jgi:hypothetical protein
MNLTHRLVGAVYIVSIGWFSLLFLPALLGTAGPQPMQAGRYLLTIIECQIPATVIATLIYLMAWIIRGSPRNTRASSSNM